MTSVPVGKARPTPAALLGDTAPGAPPMIPLARAGERIAGALPDSAEMAQLRLLAVSRCGGAAVAAMSDAQVIAALAASAMTGQLSLDGGEALREGGGLPSMVPLMIAAGAAGAAVGAAVGAAAMMSGDDDAPPPPPPAAPIKVIDPCGNSLHCVDLGETIKQASTGRQADAMGRLLEIVAPEVGSTINLTSVGSKCGKSPVWTIAGFTDSQKTGTNTTFRAERWVHRALSGLGWDSDSVPRDYRISVATPCGYSGYSHQLLVYPSDRFSITLNASDWSDVRQKLDYVIEQVLSAYVVNAKFDGPSGKVSLSAGWEEDPKSHRAFYGWKASFGVDPLVGGKCRVPFGPLAAVPQWLKQYGDAYLFVEFSGGISITGEWGRTALDKLQGTVKASGSISGKIGGSLFLMDDSVLLIEVSGSTGVSAEVFPDKEKIDQPTIDLDVKWDGLKGDFTIATAYGLVEIRREATFCDAANLMDRREFCLPDSLAFVGVH